ncbi:hypothetical protein FRB99_000896 [Tulasnella sp. 403]|nr:hypothetical protein FRB99_000896 [Tulasnella sp. 403]
MSAVAVGPSNLAQAPQFIASIGQFIRRYLVRSTLKDSSAPQPTHTVHPKPSIPLPRYFSTRALDPAHRGLALPYPDNHVPDPNVFEDPDLYLPNIIRNGDFKQASKLRTSLAKRNLHVSQDWIYQLPAVRMLSRSENPFRKVRVNSFLVWWSMVPDCPSGMDAVSSVPADQLPVINHIVSLLSDLPDSETPNSALIRFALLAARKGYASLLAQRVVQRVVLWAPPTVSCKFLSDFISLALPDMSEQSIEEENKQRAARGELHSLAIRTQLFAGRLNEAVLLYKEALRSPSVILDADFCARFEHEMMIRGRTDMFDEPVADHANELFGSTSQRSPGGRMAFSFSDNIAHVPNARAQARMNTFFIPLTPGDTLETVKHSLRVDDYRILPDHLAWLMRFYLDVHGTHNGLRLLHETMRGAPDPTTTWYQYDRRLEYWAAAEMIYHLRYRNDPLASFHVFDMYFEHHNFIPPDVFDSMRHLWRHRESTHPRDPRSAMQVFRRITGRGSSPALDRPKLWVDPDTIPIVWQTVLASRRSLGLSFENIHDMFLSQFNHPLKPIDDGHSHADISMHQLRQMHSKKPKPPKVNIYARSRPPVYAPSALHFDAFMWACSSKRALARRPGHAKFHEPTQQAELILHDMLRLGIQPTIYTWSRLCATYAYAGNWSMVLDVLNTMQAGGVLSSVTNPEDGSPTPNTTGLTRMFFLGIARGLVFSGRPREASTILSWLQKGRFALIQTGATDLGKLRS